MRRLDLRGLKCPLPALKTGRHLASLQVGAVVEVLADDPLAGLDIAHLCRTDGHEIMEKSFASGKGHRFVIRRRSD